MAASVAAGNPLAGQESWSAAFTPPHHWSIGAAGRLAALGLTPGGFDAGRAAPTQFEMGRAFEHAAAQAGSASAGALLAASYLERFRAELGLGGTGDDSGLGSSIGSVLSGSSAQARYVDHQGRAATGWGYEDGHFYGDWNDAYALPDRSTPGAAASLQASARDVAALRVTVRQEERLSVDEVYGSARLGGVVFWGGRRVLGWGPAGAPGLVVTDAAVDGAGVHSARPFHLPWLLRHAGPVHIEISIGREDFTNPCEDPTRPRTGVACTGVWSLSTRGTIAPHSRLVLGVTRAAFFGGAGNTDVDAFAVFSVLIGKHAGEVSELDNQVVSVDIGYRPPVERWLPLRLYLEWGFEDSAGAWTNVPGLLAGITIPAVPGVPALAVGFERVYFAPSCCANPIWYRHSVFHDGWTVDSRPLGHPLGGHGAEWAAAPRIDALGGRLRLEGRLYLRERGVENLFATIWEGRSRGVDVRGEWTLGQRLDVFVGAAIEDGEGWREQYGSLGLRTFF